MVDYSGFWKANCADAFGMQIRALADGQYAVAFCGPGGCGDKPRVMKLEGNPRILRERYKCTSETNPKLEYSTVLRSSDQVLGAWVEEKHLSGNLDTGQSFDTWRLLHVFRRDGSVSSVIRLYSGPSVVREQAFDGRWGMEGDLRWIECASARVDGSPAKCFSGRSESKLEYVDEREMRFTRKSDDSLVVWHRVRDDHELPGGAR